MMVKHYILGNLPFILRICNNFTSNAIKYSPLGGTIVFHSREDQEHVILEIKDQGEGFPIEMLGRLKVSSTRKSTPGANGEKGSALGLNVVAELLAKQQAFAELSNSEQGGVVTIFFKKAV
jgi:signal transduction histidine kinase